MKYFVFIKNRFNQVACVGEAEKFKNGIISLDFPDNAITPYLATEFPSAIFSVYAHT